MKRVSFVLLLVVVSSFSAAKKDPAVEQRKDFITHYAQVLERDGWPSVVLLAGKSKDMLQVWLPQTPVEGMYRFEERYVEPLKREHASEMKALGFHSIQIKTDVFSATFPKGVWDIPLD